ncbi:hypothetical protein TMatcc_004455 [Talaromyces marneffei ATCC 18224]|uniref:Zn(2)-C6 fungal-type domain-containing protein n=2 Tax=Talaromyces marneffei TaxID=37727 RepID=B6Q4K1_TALMQ|nr:uncharacterized protein EYB26_000600 [Talaromyces marneffei]EEA27260.1 conserved hypothetical protein [Talaromyces marneffei ATCC 18224]QGA12955.1 hypothetical protein EYB26_000600 [Talaromyces marneffei]
MAEPPNGSSAAGGLKAHACVLCQRRKVKCDRQEPCISCVKARVDCEYREPLPPRRRKKKDSEGTLAARVRHYEYALQKAGVDVSSLDADKPLHLSASNTLEAENIQGTPTSRGHLSTISDTPSENTPGQGPGRLVSRRGRSLYLDNHLWNSVSHELQDVNDILTEDDPVRSAEPRIQNGEEFNSSFLFGGGKPRQTLTHLHPNTIQIFQLWNTFLDGINPLTKIVHVPTLQQQILNAASDLQSLSPEMEALMFSIYSSALLCMQVDEVQKYFKESKTTLLARYRQCAQQALVNAGVLGTSELMVLQAFVLFILSVRLVYNRHILWSLTGICIRIAQRIGLHKDGSKLGLSVFETEMRRRIWWNLIVVDATIGHMAGCESHMLPLADTKLPSNINDSALDPDMKEIPKESSGPTEMFFCLMSYELGVWLAKQAKTKTSSFDGFWEFLSSTAISIEQKDIMIDEIEQLFERKYISHCDSSIALHFVTFMVAKSAPTRSRLRVHHPRQYQEKGQPLPPAERDLLLDLCFRLLEYGDLVFRSRKVQKFYWYLDFHFPWEALIVMLSVLRYHTTGQEVAKAWKLMDVLFKRQQKSMARRKRSPLHLAVANLAIKAWSAHVTEAERSQVDPLPQPEVIDLLWRYTHQDVPLPSTFAIPNEATIQRPPMASGYATASSQRPIASPTASRNHLIASQDNTAQNIYNQILPISTQGDPYNQNDEDGSKNAIETAMDVESSLLNDSPLDWDQWDALLHEFQDYDSAGDMNMLFPPPLA